MKDENTQEQMDIQSPPEDLEPEILLSETASAMRRLKSRKSAGKDRIVMEMLEATSDMETKLIHYICQKIWISCIWRFD